MLVQTTRTSALGVHRADAQGKGVDAADDFGDREGGHVADLLVLVMLAGDEAGEVAGLLDPAKVGGEVLAVL